MNRLFFYELVSKNVRDSVRFPSTETICTDSPRFGFFLIYVSAISTACVACSLLTSLINTGIKINMLLYIRHI